MLLAYIPLEILGSRSDGLQDNKIQIIESKAR